MRMREKIIPYTFKITWVAGKTHYIADALSRYPVFGNKSKYVLKMGTHMLSTWIKEIAGHNNLAYFQSKLNTEIDPTCRLCLQANETLHHLMTDCEATNSLQMDIMKNKIPLPDMTWSVKILNTFIQHPLIHSLSESGVRASAHALSQLHVRACRPELASTET